MTKIVAVMLASLCSLLLFSETAHAYLDPGSGSMLLQLLLGGVAGVTVVLKLYWRRLLHFFGLKREEEADSAAASQQAVPEADIHSDQRQ